MTEAAEGLQYFALAGWSADEMSAALEPTLKLAGAAGMQLGTTCDIVSDTMSMFGIEANQAAKMTDILAYAQANSNTSVEQLGEALKYCGASSNAMGYDLADTAGILGKFADQGLKGSAAGTTLNSMFRDMKKKAKDGAIAIGDTSVAIVDANGNYRDFNDILHDVEQATNGMSAAQRDQALSSIWGTEALRGVNMALEAGSDSIKKFEEGIRSSDGTASQMYDTMQNNLKGSIDNLKSAFEGVCITIGNLLLPIMQSLVDKLTNALTWFNNLNPGIQKVIVSVGGFIAVLGPTLMILGSIILKVVDLAQKFKKLNDMFKIASTASKVFSSALAFITSPVGLVIAAITALIAVGVLLYKNWDTVKACASTVWNAIKNIISTCVNSIKNVVTTVFNAIKSTISSILNAIKSTVSNIFNAIKNTISNILNAIKSTVSSIFNVIKSTISNILNAIKNTVSNIFNAIKSTISSILNAVKSVVSNIFNAIKTVISTCLNSVKSTVSSIFNAIKSTISSILNSIKSTVSSIFNAIKSTISSILNSVKSTVSSIFNAIKSTISSILNSVKSVVSSVFNSIRSTISSILNSVKSVVSSAFNAIKSVISSSLNGAKAVVSSAFNAIRSVVSTCSNAIRNVVSTVFSSLTNIMVAPFKAAQGIISGILGGISSMIGKVTSGISKVTSLVKGKMIERSGFDEEEFYNDNDYSMARFNYAKAQQTYYSGVLAESYSMLDTLKEFKNDLRSNKNDSGKVSTSNNFNISLNIDKMMNTDNRSIEDIADELAFYIKRKSFI